MFQAFPNIWSGTAVGQWRQALGLLHLIAANLQRRIVAVQISRICSNADGQNLNLLCPVEDQFRFCLLCGHFSFCWSIFAVGIPRIRFCPALLNPWISLDPLACADRADDRVLPFWHLSGGRTLEGACFWSSAFHTCDSHTGCAQGKSDGLNPHCACFHWLP